MRASPDPRCRIAYMRIRRSTWVRFAIADFLLVYLLWRMWTARKGSKWQASPRRHVRRILELAALQPGEVLYDLGSGDGRIVIAAAKHCGSDAVGIEIDPVRLAMSQARAHLAGTEELARFEQGDLFETDVSDADVVVVFLSQRANDRLEEKLRRELPLNARVISNRHTFSHMRQIDEDRELGIRVYRTV